MPVRDGETGNNQMLLVQETIIFTQQRENIGTLSLSQIRLKLSDKLQSNS
jgi:hypothetical protein